MRTPCRSAVRCMPSFVKSRRARASASTRAPKKPRGRRRSRCTRISAEVCDSAALMASLTASKSVMPRNRRVHFGCVAIPYQPPLAPPPPLALAPQRGGRRRPARRAPRVDRGHRGLEAGGEALLSEARRDHLADDLAGGGVGHDRLEPVADLEAKLPVLDEDDEEHAVVEPLLAESPLVEEPVGDVLQALALERAEDRDRHLRARGALVLGELRLQPPALVGREEPGVVVHAGAGCLRQDEGNGEERREQARTSPWARSPRQGWPRRKPSAGSRPSTRRWSRGRGAGACCSRAPPR